jgi:hypothetical protein
VTPFATSLESPKSPKSLDSQAALTPKCQNYNDFRVRRGGRVAEGGGLLNRRAVSKSSTYCCLYCSDLAA